MLRIQKILFPTDFSPCAGQALRHALYLAGKYQAELHMLYAIVLHSEDPHDPSHHFQDIDKIFAKLKEKAREQMVSTLSAFDDREIRVRQLQLRGISPAPVILDYAQGEDMDLIVMGTHGRRGLGHLFLGSVAEKVVRHAPCPVLTIRGVEGPKPVENIERILVPMDFSEHSKKALRYAVNIAKSYEARLQLLHVVEENMNPFIYLSGTVPLIEVRPDIKEKSREALQKYLKEIDEPEVPADIHVTMGHAASDVVSFAEKKASDLIVISTHGLTGIDHLLMGSVTEKVVRMAPCPVFTVKSFGKSLL